MTDNLHILYIHGYGSGADGNSATLLRRHLGNKAEVFAPEFSNEFTYFDSLIDNVLHAQGIIDSKQIDLVVASSMGAFTALQLQDIPTILINPCMKPSEHFGALLPEITMHEKRKYEEAEETLAPSAQSKAQTYGFFANDDELFSYASLFSSIFDPNHLYAIEGSHQNDEHRIQHILVPFIEQLAQSLEKKEKQPEENSHTSTKDYTLLLEKAINLATEAHRGQTDKQGHPYILHPLRVMNAGITMFEKMCGVLHDVVEDTPWTCEQLLNEGFPAEVVEAVKCLSKECENEDYQIFINRVCTNNLAMRVKLNDLKDNMDITRYNHLADADMARLNKYLRAYKQIMATLS